MEEKNKIPLIVPGSTTTKEFGSITEQNNIAVLEYCARDGYINNYPTPTEIPRHARGVSVTSLVVPYTPILVTSQIQGVVYSFTIFDDQWKLTNHICKHVLDPFEAWVQLDPKLDVNTIRSDLLAVDCYNHYLKSPHNFECKSCPHLGFTDCGDLIVQAKDLYISSISRIICQLDLPLYCHRDEKGNLFFVDQFGIMVYCEPTSTDKCYKVASAYRHKFRKNPPPSKRLFFDQAWKKILDKYATGGKFVILRK